MLTLLHGRSYVVGPVCVMDAHWIHHFGSCLKYREVVCCEIFKKLVVLYGLIKLQPTATSHLGL